MEEMFDECYNEVGHPEMHEQCFGDCKASSLGTLHLGIEARGALGD